MIAIIVPEPAPWLLPLLSLARERQEVTLFAPWALPASAPSWLPQKVKTFWGRRALEGATRNAQPLWSGAEAVLSLWSGQKTDRLMQARLWKRGATDYLAARWLPEGVTTVIAPSLAARRVFSAATQRGAKKILVEDLPSFRQLHEDLDRAARRLPQCVFLRRYRAPASLVAQQEAEQVLASTLLIRGLFAKANRKAQGFSEEKVLLLPPKPLPRAATRSAPSAPTFLLAGVSAARNGTMEAISAISSYPEATLLVRTGEGTEPKDILSRPNVRQASKEEQQTLNGVSAVIAPSLCESYSPEVTLAAVKGIPVIATKRGSGCVDANRFGREIEVGDSAALLSAMRSIQVNKQAEPLSFEEEQKQLEALFALL